MEHEQLLKIETVAAMLSVSVPTIRKWKDNGTLPHVKIGSALRFKLSVVLAFIEEHSTEAEEKVV